MTPKKFISIATLLVLTLFVSACTTYVPVQQGQVQPGQMQQPQYEYNPGYNPDNAIADAILLSAIVGGVNGYYGPGHIFYPSVMYGGVPGYYVGGIFHTSMQNRTVIVNHYNTGRNDFQRNPTQYAQAHPDVVRTVNGGPGKPAYGSNRDNRTMPNYSNNAGGVTRGSQTVPASNRMPAYGNGTGGVQRSSPVQSRPSYSSNTGSVSRSTTTTTVSRSSSSSSSRPSSRR